MEKEGDTIQVDLVDSAPIYTQIQNAIKKKIIDGVWMPGCKIPSEEELVNTLKVSRGTVRKAISVLVEEGTIEKIQGKGTFVTKEKISYPFAQELTSYAETMKHKNLTFNTQVLDKQVIVPDLEMQSKLNTSQNTSVLYLKRLRTVDNNQPAILLHSWVSIQLCPGIEETDFTKVSLFDAIEKSMDEQINYGTRSFSATSVTKEQADLLEIKNGDPILCIDQTTFNKAGNPIEYSKVFLRTDQYQVTSVLYR